MRRLGCDFHPAQARRVGASRLATRQLSCQVALGKMNCEIVERAKNLIVANDAY